MLKKILSIIIAVVVTIIVIIGRSAKKVNQIVNINYNDITKIVFFDGSHRNKPLTVEDRQKIKEFTGYINDCVVIKWFDPGSSGWAREAAFYENDKVVMDITFNYPIKINSGYYRVINGGLSLKKIDKFLQSVDPSWTAWN